MMHQYLRTIGFSKYNHVRELRPILNRIIMDPEEVSMVHEDEEIYGYFSRSFGERSGQRSKSAVPKPVVERIEATLKKASCRARRVSSPHCSRRPRAMSPVAKRM